MNSCLSALDSVKLKYYEQNKPRKLEKLKDFNICEKSPDFAKKAFPSNHSLLGPQFKDNDLSSVFLVQNQFLIPGDSTEKAEKIWSLDPRLPLARVFILGHHGSSTSTSEILLEHLPDYE